MTKVSHIFSQKNTNAVSLIYAVLIDIKREHFYLVLTLSNSIRKPFPSIHFLAMNHCLKVHLLVLLAERKKAMNE